MLLVTCARSSYCWVKTLWHIQQCRVRHIPTCQKPAIIDTVDPEWDKGSRIAYLDVQFFNHYVPTLQLRLRENALSVHEYVLNDGIGCLTSCNRGTGLDISSELCFRLKIIQRDKSAQQQHNARHTQTNTLQEPSDILHHQ